MKRIVPVLVCLSVLVSCLIFSASAAVTYRPDFSDDSFSFSYVSLDSSDTSTQDVTDRVSKATPGQFSFSWNPLPVASSWLEFAVIFSDSSMVVLNPGESVSISVTGQMPYRGAKNLVNCNFVGALSGSIVLSSPQFFTPSGSSSLFSVNFSFTNTEDEPVYLRSFFFYTDQPNGGSYTGFRLTVTDFVITDYSQKRQTCAIPLSCHEHHGKRNPKRYDGQSQKKSQE